MGILDEDYLRAATVNPNLMRQGILSRNKPPMQMKPLTGQSLLDGAALATSPVPIVGDVAGLMADGLRMYQNPQERTWGNAALASLGLIPFVPNMSAVRKMTKYEEAHKTAQKNAAKPVSEGGLGLPPDNTAMDRAKAMGFGEDGYHGTNSDIHSIDKEKFGSSTGATSGKQAFWAVSEPSTARGYAEYAATQAPVKALIDKAGTYERLAQKTGNNSYWDKYNELLTQAEELENSFRKNDLVGQNVMPLMVNTKNAKVMDAAGAEFTDVEGGVNSFLRKAKTSGADSAVFRNLADDVGFNGRPADHYAIFNPSAVRSRFAAFDPLRRNENNLLASFAPYGVAGLLGLGLLDSQNAEAKK